MMSTAMQHWLFLVHRIPSRPLYLRAKMLQRLTAAGAIAVKNSVYLLPHEAETLEDLQWIAQEIAAGGDLLRDPLKVLQRLGLVGEEVDRVLHGDRAGRGEALQHLGAEIEGAGRDAMDQEEPMLHSG